MSENTVVETKESEGKGSLFAVVYSSANGTVVQEVYGKPACRDLVNSIGLDKIQKVYHVAKTVELQTKTVVTF